jgi:hypothetical protein
MLHHAPHSRRARCGIALLGLVAILALPLPAVARTTVDPSTLTPPPNPAANPVCGWTGGQVQCLSDLRFTVTDAETGIFCAGGQLLENSDRHTQTHRYYNADLLLTRRITQEWIDGTLYVKETGETIRWTGTDTGIQTLRVPGDDSTGVGINSGAYIHLYLADGRSITLSGRTIEDLDTGAFSAVGSNPDGVPICDLLS